MKKLRKASLCLVIVFSMLASGCMSYHDTDKMTYVVSMLLDVEQDKKPIIYFETFIPVRSASKEASEASRRIFAVKADTVSQCLYYLRTLTNFYVTLSHCKVLFISPNAVDAGLKNYMDGFVREQDFVNRTRLAVYGGSIENYKNLQFVNEKLTGMYVFDLLEENYPISMGTRADLLTFINQCASDTHIISLPRLSIVQREMDDAPSNLRSAEGNASSGGQESSSQSSSGEQSSQSSSSQSSGGEQSGQGSGSQSSGEGQSGQGSSSQSSSGGQSGQSSSSQSSSGEQGGQSSSSQSSSGGQGSQSSSSQSSDGEKSGGGMGITGGGSGSGSGSGSQTTPTSDVECKMEGITFLDKEHLIGSLDQEHSIYYNFMTSPPDFGIIEIPHPNYKGKYVTLGILKSGNKAASTYENGTFHYHLNIKINTMFSEAQDQIDLNDQTIAAVEKSAEHLLKERCEALFREYQTQGKDVFRMQEVFDRLHPKEKKTEILKKTDMTVDFQIEVSSTHKAFNWR